MEVCPFSRFGFNRIGVLLIVMLFSSLAFPAESPGQRRSKKKSIGINIGEIIRYSNVHGEGYALVIEIKSGGNAMKVEEFDEFSGDLGESLIINTPTLKWEKVKPADEENATGDLAALIERRDELMKTYKRHVRLAKLNPNPVVGDILEFTDFHDGLTYGVVTQLGRSMQVESVKNGEFEAETFNSLTDWTYYDRPMDGESTASRTWSSPNGTFSIAAKLLSADGDMLKLKRDNGKTLNVSLNKLSKADRKYVDRMRGRLGNADEASVKERRSEYDENLQMLLERRAELVKREGANRVAAKAANRMKSISLKTNGLTMSADQLKPLGIKQSPTMASMSIQAPEQARIRSICHAAETNVVAFTAVNPFKGQPTLGVINLDNSDSITNVDSDSVGSDASVVAISPSGKKLIVFSGERSDKSLELWSHLDGKLTKESVISYESFHVPSAHLFNEQRGVVMNTKGELVFFDVLEQLVPTHQIPIQRRAQFNSFEVTNDQKSIVYFDSSRPGISVIDAATGKSLGGLAFDAASDTFRPSSVQLNPDGETIAFLHNNKLVTYSLESGEPVAEHDVPNPTAMAMMGQRKAFQFLSPDLLMVYGGNLIDSRHGIEIGSVDSRYQTGERRYGNATRVIGELDDSPGGGVGGFGRRGNRGSRGFGGRGFGGAGAGTGAGGRRGQGTQYVDASAKISLQRLPVEEIVRYADSITEDDIVDFGDGDAVQLVFDIGGQKGLEDRIRNTIEEIFAENNIEVVRKSDYVLRFVFKVGAPQTETYNIIGGMTPRTRTATVTPKTCRAELTFEGQRIWSQGASGGLGNPWSESDLDNNISNAKSINANMLLDFSYPNRLRVVDPRKKRKFNWQ
jgi:hypothetical protein